MQLLPVPRLRTNEFRPSRWAGGPRVIVDNVRAWKALDRWQPDYLKSAVGDSEVSVREVNGPPRNVFQSLAAGGRISFSDYIDWVLATADDLLAVSTKYSEASDIAREVARSGLERSYYLDIKLAQLSKTLLDDTAVPAWYRTTPVDINFWCGVLGTSSGLHCDVTPNCNVQVAGSKHFILFPPSQSGLLYRIPKITHCRFDPNMPDFDRFPLARSASGWQCTLRPGESLYIPVGWYHQVTVVSGWAVNVNFFWPRPFPQGLATPPLWHFLLRRSWAGLRRALFRSHQKPQGTH
ncbi:MAG TPA: cupin-like domain-containing protein [Kofleriaceae bacterium]